MISLTGFLTALPLLTRNKTHADRILTVWMAVMTVRQVITYLQFNRRWWKGLPHPEKRFDIRMKKVANG